MLDLELLFTIPECEGSIFPDDIQFLIDCQNAIKEGRDFIRNLNSNKNYLAYIGNKNSTEIFKEYEELEIKIKNIMKVFSGSYDENVRIVGKNLLEIISYKYKDKAF